MDEDGIHVSGNKKVFWFIHPSFHATIGLHIVAPDVFDVSLDDAAVAGFSLAPFTNMVLEAVRNRLNHALRVSIDSKALVPAFQGLHLIEVALRPRMFLRKVGHIAGR